MTVVVGMASDCTTTLWVNAFRMMVEAEDLHVQRLIVKTNNGQVL